MTLGGKGQLHASDKIEKLKMCIHRVAFGMTTPTVDKSRRTFRGFDPEKSIPPKQL